MHADQTEGEKEKWAKGQTGFLSPFFPLPLFPLSIRVYPRASVVSFLAFENLVKPLDGASQVRDRDRPADDERDVEGV